MWMRPQRKCRRLSGNFTRSEAATTVKSVEKRFEDWVDKENAEGLVVRSDTAGLFKVKPRHTIDAAVIGTGNGQVGHRYLR